jgi:hypothetical protein
MGGVLRNSAEAPDEDVVVLLRRERSRSRNLSSTVLRKAGLEAAALESFIHSGAVGPAQEGV